MAASTVATKEPLMRAVIRFMHAIRQENAELAVELLRDSVKDRLIAISYNTLLIPSSENGFRAAILSGYLQNQSASKDDIIQALWSVLTTERERFVYNIYIETSPLLLAIKQGDVYTVSSLLQQLPRIKAVRLVLDGPDADSISSLKTETTTESAEKLCNVIFNSYALNDKLRPTFSRLLHGTLLRSISEMSKHKAFASGFMLAASMASSDILTLLLFYLNIGKQDLDMESYFYIWINCGRIIASQSPDKAVGTANMLLGKIPIELRQSVCTHWLISCVIGGVCGVEAISLILKYVTWDKYVRNVTIGLLINTWSLRIHKDVLIALVQFVPDNDIVITLMDNFDDQNFAPHSDSFLCNKSGSVFCAARSNNDIQLIENCLSETQVQNIVDYAKSSLNTVSSDVLALCERHLHQYLIPENPQAKLQMYGLVCYNEGVDDLLRSGAEIEAQAITKGLTDAGINLRTKIKNWSTYSFLQHLRKFCEEIRENCALAVVCIMAHGKAGLLFSNTHSSDSCQITDVLSILDERLPSHIPKVRKQY